MVIFASTFSQSFLSICEVIIWAIKYFSNMSQSTDYPLVTTLGIGNLTCIQQWTKAISHEATGISNGHNMPILGVIGSQGSGVYFEVPISSEWSCIYDYALMALWQYLQYGLWKMNSNFEIGMPLHLLNS